MKRWSVHITRRHDDGYRMEHYQVEELDEVADIVEAGPHWDTIGAITIARAGGSALTVEEAAKL